MAGRPVEASRQARVLEAYARTGSITASALEANVDRATARKIVRRSGLEVRSVVRLGGGDGLVSPGAVSESPPDAATLPPIVLEMLLERSAKWAESKEASQPVVEAASDELESVLPVLRKSPLTLAEIATRGKVSQDTALAWIEAQKSRGVNIQCFGGSYSIETTFQSSHDLGVLHEYVSRPDNTFLFGACGDQHLCSKYERLDVLERIYDRYASAGVDRVFNTGNWIDGEARFNKYDLKVHGMAGQLAYLAEHYPRRPGIHTYAVAGDDHEGWYGQREGVDIGRYAEHAMRDAGRDDWHDLGYMEAHVKLINANTGATAMLAVVHPGGGSAYALSYSIQKIVESYDGGEKPAVGLYGHYHKLWAGNIRNVWTCQTGTAQDQTPFMRKKRLEAHVGAFLVGLTQDPETGAIVEMTPTMLRYFNRGFYNNRWSHAKDVTLPMRT